MKVTHLPMDLERHPEVVRDDRETGGPLVMRCQWQHCKAEFEARRTTAKWCPTHNTSAWKKREQERARSVTVDPVRVGIDTHSPTTHVAPGGMRWAVSQMDADGLLDADAGELPTTVRIGPDGPFWSSDHVWKERWHPDYMPPELPEMVRGRLVNYQLATLEPGERVIGDPGPRTDEFGAWCEALCREIWGDPVTVG